MVGYGARPTWPVPSFFVGVDLGQASDFTAIAIIQRDHDLPGAIYRVRHIERTRGVPYPLIVDRIHSLIHTPELEAGIIYLVVDKTGVGAPVVDLLRDRNLNPISVTITGGDRPSNPGKREWHVPKRDLMSNLLVLSQSGRLKIAADLKEAKTFLDELQNMRVKIDIRTAHDSYSAWRESAHDDLVLAVALAAWWAENRPPVRLVVPAIFMGD